MFLQDQPKWVIAGFGLAILFGVWAIVSGNWTPQTQLVTIGAFILLFVVTQGEQEKQKVNMKEAAEAGYKYVRHMQVRGYIPTGTLKVIPEQIMRQFDGEEKYWEVGIKLESTAVGEPIYKVKIDKFKDSAGNVEEKGITLHKKWSAQDSPDVMVVEPPDIVQYMKLKKRLEGEGKK